MIRMPLTGNYVRGRAFVLRHRCWRDRVPWLGKWHLARLIGEIDG